MQNGKVESVRCSVGQRNSYPAGVRAASIEWLPMTSGAEFDHPHSIDNITQSDQQRRTAESRLLRCSELGASAYPW